VARPVVSRAPWWLSGSVVLPRSAVALAATLALGLLAAPAPAATISGGATITVTSGAESEDFYVSENGAELIFGRNSTAAPALIAQGTCTQSIPDAEVTCPRANIVANLGAGDDQAGFGSIGTSTVEAHGGEGNDFLGGGPGADKLYGEAGTDRIEAAGGADTIDGGDGNDSFDRVNGADDVVGGPGGDTLEFYGAPDGVFVSLNDIADDGPAAARTANVHSDVEGVQGSPLDDHLIGNSTSNDLHGNDGNDEVIGGGGAFDTLRGDKGNDTLDAVNLFEDDLGCGDGADTIRIDPRDKVYEDCESVTVVGPDADGDGSKPPIDCDDANAAVHPGGTDVPGNGIDEDCSGADAPLVDLDGDGVTADRDCNDASAGVRPGAVDKPGNGIDEDCDGADDPFLLVAGSIGVQFRFSGGRMRITQLRVTGAQTRAKAQVRCRGRGCPFTSKTLKLKRGRATGTSLLAGRRLRVGVVVEVRLTAPGTIGKVTRLTVTTRRVRQQALCLPPGATTPRAC